MLAIVVMAVLIVAYDFVTTRTTVGRRIYALGNNALATYLSGIDTRAVTVIVFVVTWPWPSFR